LLEEALRPFHKRLLGSEAGLQQQIETMMANRLGGCDQGTVLSGLKLREVIELH
jgi:hypothetical protein